MDISAGHDQDPSQTQLIYTSSAHGVNDTDYTLHIVMLQLCSVVFMIGDKIYLRKTATREDNIATVLIGFILLRAVSDRHYYIHDGEHLFFLLLLQTDHGINFQIQ